MSAALIPLAMGDKAMATASRSPAEKIHSTKLGDRIKTRLRQGKSILILSAPLSFFGLCTPAADAYYWGYFPYNYNWGYLPYSLANSVFWPLRSLSYPLLYNYGNGYGYRNYSYPYYQQPWNYRAPGYGPSPLDGEQYYDQESYYVPRQRSHPYRIGQYGVDQVQHADWAQPNSLSASNSSQMPPLAPPAGRPLSTPQQSDSPIAFRPQPVIKPTATTQSVRTKCSSAICRRFCQSSEYQVWRRYIPRIGQRRIARLCTSAWTCYQW
jgi:hypothetical protein